MWLYILLIYGISFCEYRRSGSGVFVAVDASTLPTAVQLGGAIVAAVEEDIEQEEQQKQQEHLQQPRAELWHYLFGNNNADVVALQRFMSDFQEGRGKYHKRKILKYLYPLLVGVLIAKTILVPLILKMLTALSTSSFVMSKIALITAGILSLKWLLAGTNNGGGYYTDGIKERTHLEVVHLPFMKAYNRGGGGGGIGWNDLTLSGSSLVDTKLEHRHKYIPVGGVKDGDITISTMSVPSSIGGGGGGGVYRTQQYPQHNYDSSIYDGKPFL